MAKKVPVKQVDAQNAEDVIEVTTESGNILTNMFRTNNDIKVGREALDYYRHAVNTGKALLAYKKLTGKPGTIAFFESREETSN